ncbi:UMP kinase [Microbaculum sp. FT89]|uniref:UMP kinase n=1 Tax=Microbaculum sp. FT89 TaxID=3447298 RepID=UPI003F534E09
MPEVPEFKRVLLKVSGEALMGEGAFGIDVGVLGRIGAEVVAASRGGTQIAIVVGGGNLFRGVAGAARGMDRARADHIGMLATVMNSIALAGAIDEAGGKGRALSAIPMEALCGTYTRTRALECLDAGEIVICAGGTGNPFFTTDSAAALRAAELNCDALLKGTQVDGIYEADPRTHPGAKRFDTLTFAEALKRDLKVMDTAAFALARDNAIPIIVFDIHETGSLDAVLAGTGRATLVSG